MYLTCLLYVFRIILGAGYRSLISSLFNYVHSPVTLSSCGPNIFLSTRSPITLSSVREAKFHTHKKKNRQNSVLCLRLRIANWKTKNWKYVIPLCVWKLERVCSQTQLCQLRCFNDYIRQLHVSAPPGHLQVVFKRTYLSWRWPVGAETCSCLI